MHIDKLLRPYRTGLSEAKRSAYLYFAHTADYEFFRPKRGIIAIEVLAAQGPVGTRGGVEWMRGPGACPGWGATWLLHAVPTGSHCQQDKHQAPTLPHIRPLSLQDPIRSSTFIRIGADTFPVLVVNIHYRPLPDVPIS